MSREGHRNAHAKRLVQLLQWGLDISVEEGTSACARVAASITASMGPRHFSRGRMSRAERISELTSSLQWGLDISVEEGLGI